MQKEIDLEFPLLFCPSASFLCQSNLTGNFHFLLVLLLSLLSCITVNLSSIKQVFAVLNMSFYFPLVKTMGMVCRCNRQ